MAAKPACAPKLGRPPNSARPNADKRQPRLHISGGQFYMFTGTVGTVNINLGGATPTAAGPAPMDVDPQSAAAGPASANSAHEEEDAEEDDAAAGPTVPPPLPPADVPKNMEVIVDEDPCPEEWGDTEYPPVNANLSSDTDDYDDDEDGDALKREVDHLHADAIDELPVVADAPRPPKKKYTRAQREYALTYASSCSSLSAAARHLATTTAGMESVSRQTLTSWKRQGPHKQRGPRANAAFEGAVLDTLMLVALTPSRAGGQTSTAFTTANVAHSRGVITTAAREVQKWPQFLHDATVSQLKFSVGWVTNFLARNNLSRRRITSVDKTRPSPEDCRARMAAIQHDLLGVELDAIINGDETAVFYGCNPHFQYTLNSVARGSAPESNQKTRFTAFLFGSAAGTFYPAFIIIKCTTKNKHDLSSSRVLKKWHDDPTFNRNISLPDGSTRKAWVLEEWSRTIAVKEGRGKKAALVERLYKRPYLRHVLSRHIITVHHKAWMDTAGVCMWADVQLGPIARKAGLRYHLVWDNCGPHNTAAALAVLKEHSVKVHTLPPRMSDKLQIMDLVVNGPMKAAMRKARCDALFEQFQLYRARHHDVLSQPPETRDLSSLPRFSPDALDLKEGVLQFLAIRDEKAGDGAFKTALQRTFVSACQAPDDKQNFRKYPRTHEEQGKGCGVFLAAADVLCDLFVDLEVCSRTATCEGGGMDIADEDTASDVSDRDESEEEERGDE